MSGFDGTLDLTGANADDVGFPPIPSGTYECLIGKADWRETSNIDGSGKLPHGTPYLNIGVQVKEDEPERDGQRVAKMYAGFAKLFVPPADYDPAKAQRMKNAMANFLNAIGEQWQSKNYKMPNTDDLVGREIVAVVRKKPDARSAHGYSNEIEGFKPAGTANQSAEPAGRLR